MNKYNILIVEDIHQMIKLYEYCLRDKFNIHSAKNFDDLQSIENKKEMDIAILDFHIPGENFDDILAYVKTHYPNAQRIIISGHANSMELAETYKDDVLEVFQKPLKNYKDFKEYVLTLLEDETSPTVKSEVKEEVISQDTTVSAELKVDSIEEIKQNLNKNEFNKDEMKEALANNLAEDKSHQDKSPTSKFGFQSFGKFFKK